MLPVEAHSATPRLENARRATAILAFSRLFFCSGDAIPELYQNSTHLLRYEALVLRCGFDTVAILHPARCERDQG